MSSTANVGRVITRHKAAIDALCHKHDLKASGFAKAMLAAIPEEERQDARKIVKAVVPDAWRIHDGTVEIYEVSDTHPLKREKLLKYSDLALFLEDCDMAIRVFEYSVHFASTVERFPIDEWLADVEQRFSNASHA